VSNFINKNIAVAYIASEIQTNGDRRIIKTELLEELNSIINLGNTLSAKYNTNE
jgi:hypothetical protein